MRRANTRPGASASTSPFNTTSSSSRTSQSTYCCQHVRSGQPGRIGRAGRTGRAGRSEPVVARASFSQLPPALPSSPGGSSHRYVISRPVASIVSAVRAGRFICPNRFRPNEPNGLVACLSRVCGGGARPAPPAGSKLENLARAGSPGCPAGCTHSTQLY